MNLIKCPNNHFYDASKFASCPHCNLDNPSKNDVTVPVDNGQGDIFTVPMDSGMSSPAPVSMGMPAPSPVNNVQKITPQSNPVFNQVTVPNTPPVRVEDNEVTMPLKPPAPVNDVNTDSLRAQIAEIKKQSAPPAADDDDQHTISIYQDELTSKAGIEPVVGWFVVINGQTRGKSITIKAGRSFVGRAPSNDIVIEGDVSISREKHAVVVFEPKLKSFLLQPGSSRELFYLNGEVVLETVKLKAYDRIEIGKTILLFVPLCGENFSWEKENEESEKDDK